MADRYFQPSDNVIQEAHKLLLRLCEQPLKISTDKTYWGSHDEASFRDHFKDVFSSNTMYNEPSVEKVITYCELALHLSEHNPNFRFTNAAGDDIKIYSKHADTYILENMTAITQQHGNDARIKSLVLKLAALYKAENVDGL